MGRPASALNRKLSLTFIIPLFFITVFAIGGLLLSNSATAKRANESVFNSLLLTTVRNTENWLADNTRIAERYAALTEHKKLNIDALTSVQLSGILSEIVGCYDIYFGHEKDGRLYTMLEDMEELYQSGFDPRKRPWYQEAVANPSRTVISEPYSDAISGDMVVTFSRKAKDGVVGLDLTTAEIASAISKLHVPGNGFAVLVYGDEHRILAYRDNRFNNEPIEKIDAALTSDVIKTVISNSARSVETEVSMQDGEMLVMSQPIEGVPWNLLIFVDKDFFYSSFLQLLSGFIVVTVVITALSYFGMQYYVANKVVRPIRQVNRHLIKLSSGQTTLSERLNIATGDEIESMSTSLNEFLEKQKENIGRIRDQMQESVRTTSDNNSIITRSIGAQKENVVTIHTPGDSLPGWA
ncbi:MAG: HAMP domain-containing protein [Succinivibrionaceae bacterium]|nr:HAMP domain-containing protein [Succinivibrionaceae bacterium]